MQYLFEQCEKKGHFINRNIIDAVMQEMLTLLHLDSGSGTGAASASAADAAAGEKDSLKIQGAISSLSAIMDVIFSYGPYAQEIKPEYFHG